MWSEADAPAGTSTSAAAERPRRLRRSKRIRSARSRAARSGPEPLPSALLTALAFASGCIDAMSYVALGKVFTANMTGNTVLLGIAVVSGQWTRVGRSGCALAGFCAGVALAATVLRARATGALWSRRATSALAFELLPLVALALAGGAVGAANGDAYWLIALAGVAMGIQSAAVRTVAIAGVTTTYISNMLTKLVGDGAIRIGEQLGRRTGVWRLARHSHGARDDGLPPAEREVGGQAEEPSGLRLPAAVWSTYLVAALASAALTESWGVRSTWIAVATVAAVVATAELLRRRLA
jgi:uncharacterized membrane protein YoaK (UPF0700 family)